MFNLLISYQNNDSRPFLLKESMIALILIFVFAGNILFSALGLVQINALINIDELYSIHNIERKHQGLPPLKINQLLINSAKAKAQAMLDSNCWSHYCPDGKSPWDFFNEAKYEYVYAGENLAEGYADNQIMMNAWMKSPSHRENILNNNFDEIGIALVQGNYQNINNNAIVVIHFGRSAESIEQSIDILSEVLNKNAQDKIPPVVNNDDFTVNTITKDQKDYYQIVFENSDVSKLIVSNDIVPEKINSDSWQFMIAVQDLKNYYQLNIKAYDDNENEARFELPIPSIIERATFQNNYNSGTTNIFNTAFSEISTNPKIQLNLSVAVFLTGLFGIDFYILERTGKTTYIHSNRHLFIIMVIIFLLFLSVAGFGGQILDGVSNF